MLALCAGPPLSLRSARPLDRICHLPEATSCDHSLDEGPPVSQLKLHFSDVKKKEKKKRKETSPRVKDAM